MIKISENNIQLWLMDFELWQLPLDLWRNPPGINTTPDPNPRGPAQRQLTSMLWFIIYIIVQYALELWDVKLSKRIIFME